MTWSLLVSTLRVVSINMRVSRFLAGEVSAAANNVRSLVVQRKVRVILFVAGCCC